MMYTNTRVETMLIMLAFSTVCFKFINMHQIQFSSYIIISCVIVYKDTIFYYKLPFLYAIFTCCHRHPPSQSYPTYQICREVTDGMISVEFVITLFAYQFDLDSMNISTLHDTLHEKIEKSTRAGVVESVYLDGPNVDAWWIGESACVESGGSCCKKGSVLPKMSCD